MDIYDNGYLTFDIDEQTGNSKGHSIELINNDHYKDAERWCLEQLGNMDETTWWIAPYLIVDKYDLNTPVDLPRLIQKYSFVFINQDVATQFKLMGF